jgi:uncharacterized linocin/CFP29 family protein
MMAAPDTVRVTYRDLDGVHVFTSDDVRGLYVADRDIRQAYEEVPQALSELLKFRDIDASYRAVMTTDEFVRFVGHLDDDIPHPSVLAARNVAYNRAA